MIALPAEWGVCRVQAVHYCRVGLDYSQDLEVTWMLGTEWHSLVVWVGGRGVLMMTGMDGVWNDCFTSRVGCVQSTACGLL